MKYFLVLAIMLIYGDLFAQSTRSSVNKGVDLYHGGKYIDSEVEFKKGLEKSPENFQANFDLGDSYYKEGKYDEAMKSYGAALSKAGTNDLKARVYHNMGNALLKDQKIKESVGAYIESLKLNPNDEPTKYNLSYALDLLKNQNQQNKNNKNNQDQNKNDQNKEQNKNNQDQQNKNDRKNQQQNQQAQQPPPKISKDQAESIFNALNNDEKNLQKQLRKMKGQPVKTDKDW
ncbi:MAG TPA: tetratricopeptide repeat protein [Candidatus Acidoferrales bacterium]|nr:tetratricopeptide repeat protein [Candidatus Acidoferrales bacterium]